MVSHVFTALGVIVASTVGLSWLAEVVVDNRRAEAAADLVALAAAEDGCGHAGTVAVGNDVTLLTCAAFGDTVTVTVHLGWADATARAGVM